VRGRWESEKVHHANFRSGAGAEVDGGSVGLQGILEGGVDGGKSSVLE